MQTIRRRFESFWEARYFTQNRRTQLDGLLFGPWEESEAAQRADNSLLSTLSMRLMGQVVLTFLRDLVNAISKSNEKCLSGLKFFVTSRSD
jgi:hypothetical protein